VIIETDRLCLRPHGLADFADCAAMWADPEITRYTIGDPAPPQRTWARILAYRGHWELLGYGYWAVEEKASSRYIGELGFADFKRDLQPSIEGMPELGWVINVHAQGKGYSTEALRAVVAWGDSHFGSRPTVCIIHRDNRRSFRVAEKLGYATTLRAATNEEPSVILVRPGPVPR